MQDRKPVQAQSPGLASKAASAWAVGALALNLLVADCAAAAPAPVEVLKEMPTKGTLRQGEVIFVDDGRCPRGEVRKITGGNQKSGVARQSECVANPNPNPSNSPAQR